MTKSFIALAALLAALVGPAHGAGEIGAFRDTVVEKFTADDLALMHARIDQALAAEKDGETLAWKSDKTKASGSVTALNRLTWNGLACRRVQIVNTYDTLKGSGAYKFCEKPAGSWKLVGPDPAPR
jgi:surface antigen